MDEAVSIRPAVPADARAMGEIAVASWKAAYTGLMPDALLALQSVDEREHRFHEILESVGDERSNWVILRNTDVVGYASTGPTRDEDLATGTAELYALYLAPAEWGRGLAGPLQARALDALREAGHDQVTLWVLTTNSRARRFYEKSGFVLDPGAVDVVKVLREFELPHTRYRMQLA